MIYATELTFSYPRSDEPVVRGLNFAAQEGEFVSVVGKSGSGKTTLLKLLAGFLFPSSGLISLAGASPPVAQQRGWLGYMWQQDSLLPWLTVYENLRLPFTIGQNLQTVSPETILTSLDEVNLQGLENLHPTQLSGGMKQRAAFARCLITRPKIMFLDEPFSSLDEVTRDKLLTLVKEKSREHGITTVLVTHNLRDAIRISDRIDVVTTRSRTISNSFYTPNESVQTKEEEVLLMRERLFKEIVACLQDD